LWAQFDNAGLKRILDRDFPIPDFTLEGIVNGAFSAGNPDQIRTEVDLAVLHHVRLLLQERAQDWCCQGIARAPIARDYLDLIEATAEINPLREVRFLRETQGVPDRALARLARIENSYQGNPAFELVLGQSQIDRAASLSRAESTTLRRTALEHLRAAFYASQTQTRVAAEASRALDGMGDVAAPQDRVVENFYAGELPTRPYYALWYGGGAPRLLQGYAEAALRNTSSDLGPLRYLVWSYGSEDPTGEGKVAQLFRSVEGRFVGSTTLYDMKYQFAIKRGDDAAAEENLRKSIEIQPRAWQAYDQLADLYVYRGRWEQAAEIYLQFPGFRGDPGFNPVEIANRGAEAANRFYRVGAPSLAVKFYEIASRQSTGAAADNVSVSRIALYNGDFEAASAAMLDCARHYGDAGCYETYLDIRFALGDGQQAWDAFRTLIQQFDRSSVWLAAMTGHHMEHSSESDIIAWARQRYARGEGKAENRLAILLLREGVTDRAPSDGLAAAVAEVALPASRKSAIGGGVVQPPYPGGPDYILGPRRSRGAAIGATAPPPTPAMNPLVSEEVPVKSGLVYFAEIERALHGHQSALAAQIAKEAAAIYDLGNTSSGYGVLLPYFAFAVTQAGDPAAAESYLSSFAVLEQGFNYYLARAAVAALQGRTTDALQALRQARNRRPWGGTAALDTAYEYAEICAMLGDATNAVEFRDEALDWAKAIQKVWPTAAWTYSLTAVMTGDAAERVRAIALASYLDPNSEWLKRVPAAERAAAVKTYQGRNPFLKDPALRRPDLT
jgi:tetratricopeptide (TPR) repeat protein